MTRPVESPAALAPSSDVLDASVRLARLRQAMFARVEAPRIAQYHVLRPLGGGGMGLVFAAWDPALDRVIAIKVLRDPASDAGELLRREAVALARLRHPNVVSVFEVGEHAGQVYLAMELVDGETLRAWVRRWRARPRRDLGELVRVFVQIADGLAAAHAAGLVHRDVKPENVMIDGDGRVRVMDFGLARAQPRPRTDHDDARPSGGGTTTQSQGLVGTPAYMAPEQFDGAPAGPAADQFAFVATLFEALYGQRARPERMDAAAAVALDPIAVPRERGVPRRMQQLIRRGLALAPEQRWPSMRALVEELRALQRPAWQRWALAGGTAVATAGIAVGLAVAAGRDAMCTGSEAQLAGVWDATRAQALSQAADGGAASFVGEALARVVPRLDVYRDDWVAAHHDTCEAAQRRGDITQAQMDLRMACLDDRRHHLGALVDVIAGGDAEAIALAEQAVAELPSIASCSDAAYVARQGYRASEQAAARPVDERVVRAEVERSAGAAERARALAAAARDDALGQGDGVAIARASLALGRAEAALFATREAYATLVEAYERARREHLLEVAIEAATELVRVTGVDLSRADEGSWWLRIAELDGSDEADPRLHVRRELAAAAMLDASGHSHDALARAQSAYALLRDELHADGRELASAQLSVGQFQLLTGEIDRGAQTIAAGAEALRAAVGDAHPDNARAQRLLAHAARLRGDVEGANRHAERALALAEAALGSDHVALTPMLESLALGRALAGRDDEAVAALDRALALTRPRPLHDGIRARLIARRSDALAQRDLPQSLAAREQAYALARKAYGEQHRITVRYLAALGESLAANGRTDEAIETISLALVIGKTVLGDEHPEIASIDNSLALVYDRSGQHERALVHHRAQLELLERLHGPDAYPLAGAHNNVCTGLIRLERAAEAIPHCRRAVAIADAVTGESPTLAAELNNTLGGALALTGALDEAEAAFIASREGWRAALGPGSVEESTPVLNLGEIALRRGDRVAGCRLLRDALRLRTARLGADHPSTEAVRLVLAPCDG
ncbi:MAG: serine/threonine-protein kinase [Nannocystaceae bacterium]|nr:serine/threonine-protein kinase [Nannocystaceae bacterium]